MKELLLYILELKFLLPKETLNLEKINKLYQRVNNLMEEKPILEKEVYYTELIKVSIELWEIKTKEHKSKIDLLYFLIKSLLWVKQ